MSAVTLGDIRKVLAMVEPGINSQYEDRLLSLARQTRWTTKQRALVDKLWQERLQRKEAEMKKKLSFAVLAAVMLVGLSGCAATYEKRFTDHEGRAVVITEYHEADWWNNLGTPDWMNVRHETIVRDGKVLADRDCRHEPTRPTLLDCTK